ncbi:DUF4283 domain-containing protein, partial [Cephalotus follicularis]
RWSPSTRRHDSPLAAVWMRFPGLPLPLHNPSILKAIGNSFGRYLRSDAHTARFKHPREARICVELNISSPPPPAFIVVVGDMVVRQRIVIETRCLYCSFCLLQGHNTSSCRNSKGKHPTVASFPSAPSGKNPCGGVLLAGTSSPEPTNPSPPLPNEPPTQHPPGVCENAQVTSLPPVLPTLGVLVTPGQAQTMAAGPPSAHLVGSG